MNQEFNWVNYDPINGVWLPCDGEVPPSTKVENRAENYDRVFWAALHFLDNERRFEIAYRMFKELPLNVQIKYISEDMVNLLMEIQEEKHYETT